MWVTSLAIFLIGGCSHDEPSYVNEDRVEVHTREYAYKAPVEELDQKQIDSIGQHYFRYSNGPALITVTYNPVSKSGSAMNASMEAAKIAGKLRKAGIDDLATDILPVESDRQLLLVTFEEVRAHKPRNCSELPGTNSITDVDKFGDYKFGCSIEARLANQIQHPRDLLGQQPGRYSEGRRQTNVLEYYYSGEPNEPLEGEEASE